MNYNIFDNFNCNMSLAIHSMYETIASLIGALFIQIVTHFRQSVAHMRQLTHMARVPFIQAIAMTMTMIGEKL